MIKKLHFTLLLIVISFSVGNAQHSIAREWNEILLDGIRGDFARPTVHARNLFHTSIIMYDSWAIFDENATTVFLGRNFNAYYCPYSPVDTPSNIEAATSEVMSYAMYRILIHRFQDSPGFEELEVAVNSFMDTLGYDVEFTETDYAADMSFAALGNYLAAQLIQYGLQDGANEENGYNNEFYSPINEPLLLEVSSTDNPLNDPNRWQPLAFDVFVDQSGNVFANNTPSFLSPEWGQVKVFALNSEDLTIANNGFESYLYDDPGPPPYIQSNTLDGFEDPYKWNFALVSSWSSHLDADDATQIDISPASLGNISPEDYPSTFEEYQTFYDFDEGGDIGTGHVVNPKTGLPYEQQLVKRADYARVLAEFWADGPDSETPPGHWYTILNYVSDHPETIKRIGGIGNLTSDLEWDVKAYLALGGAMHDAAVTTWGIKGYYDYIRPISAIRYMARGQSTDANLASYDPHGLPLVPGKIELIETGDPLAGNADENVGRLKVFAWRGPDFINDPDIDTAGVGWILAADWWPYQRPSFVTPPFAGYISGHSTFSSAAAEVLTLFTGDAFFPGGMGVFQIEKDNFLVFEEGPSESFELQWATYKDASDQTSLSRIWGGIHPPIDDIPGRIIGQKIGEAAFALAQNYYAGGTYTDLDNFSVSTIGESCFESGNGQIVIEAAVNADYVATIDGQDYNFIDELVVRDLAPNTYQLCIRVDQDNEFERCYNLEVTRVESISGNAKYLPNKNVVEISMSSGTMPFTVSINENTFATFLDSVFEIPYEKDAIFKVESAKSCEGVFEKKIEEKRIHVLYPNPVSNATNIFIDMEDGWVNTQLYDVSGRLISTRKYHCQDKSITPEFEKLTSGVFYLVLEDSYSTTFTIVKK